MSVLMAWPGRMVPSEREANRTMGYDVIGIQPKSKTGEYFRNSIGQWRPLWHCICNNTPELSEAHRFFGQHNEGILIEGDLHGAVIRALRRLLETCPENEMRRALEQSPYLEWEGKKWQTIEMAFTAFGAHHQFEWENVRNFLRFCEANKGFRID